MLAQTTHSLRGVCRPRHGESPTSSGPCSARAWLEKIEGCCLADPNNGALGIILDSICPSLDKFSAQFCSDLLYGKAKILYTIFAICCKIYPSKEQVAALIINCQVPFIPNERTWCTVAIEVGDGRCSKVVAKNFPTPGIMLQSRAE